MLVEATTLLNQVFILQNQEIQQLPVHVSLHVVTMVVSLLCDTPFVHMGGKVKWVCGPAFLSELIALPIDLVYFHDSRYRRIRRSSGSWVIAAAWRYS